MKRMTYKDAGVDIDAGDALVRRIKPLVAATKQPGVLSDIGGFGGLFGLDTAGMSEPVLVSGTDGVGTKLKIAFLTGCHDTVGIDLVAMCVNDIVVTGAKPLFFLDYFACGKLDVDAAADVVAGIADGCRDAECALIGGETAEMPGFYGPGEYDLAGFAVGIVDRPKMIDGGRVAPGDAVLGLASSGLHSNGYSLARRVFEVDGVLDVSQRIDGLNGTLGEVLLAPTRIYVRAIQRLLAACDVRAIAHITGGGITGNLPRVLPDGTAATLDSNRWELPAVFQVIEDRGGVPREEMYRTFNMGLGMCVVVPEADVTVALETLAAADQIAWRVGTITAGAGEVRID